MNTPIKTVAAFILISTASAASFGDVISDIRSSVKDNWRKLTKRSAEIGDLREERKSLPDRSWWFFTTDKRDQDAKIRERLMAVRELLLSTNARKILEDVDELDEDLAELDEEIRDVTEERALDPELREKCDAKLEKLAARRAALAARRAESAKVVRDELRALGLSVSGEAAENCLFTVNFGDLIDGVVIARNVAVVVEDLRKLMADGDVVTARRYFGIYLVMIDVQIACFEDYLDKSRNGEWRKGIERIREAAAATREQALANAKDCGYTEAQQQIFVRNAAVNDSTIRATEAYLGVLDAHEAIIADKLAAAQKMRTLVANSYETVNLAGDFIELAKSNQEAFDSLLSLDLPPIQAFDDAAVQQEFLAITKKLKE